jgi:hypothetical protein
MVQDGKFDKPRSNNIIEVPMDPKFNTLLRIMQRWPTKLPEQVRDGSASQPEWSEPRQKRPANDFLGTELKSALRNFVRKSRTSKDTYRAVPGKTRRVYLFVPLVHQDLKESKITYKITEIFISQAEIAEALSMWWRSKSGTRQFSSLESSQKQALAQMEAERGKLFPTHFMMDFVQYTSQRMFSSAALSLKSHDIIVVIEEFDPNPPKDIAPTGPVPKLNLGLNAFPETIDLHSSPIRRRLDEEEGWEARIDLPLGLAERWLPVGEGSIIPESSERNRRSFHRLTWQRQNGEIVRTSPKGVSVGSRSAEDFVDNFIKKFGILSM